MLNIDIRQGSLKDIDFIVTCIIEAEKAGRPVSSYEKIFGISDAELRTVLKNILLEEVEGCEQCCENYIIAFDGDTPIAGEGAWIEGSGMASSNVIRTNNFKYFLRDKWQQAEESMKVISKYEIPRIPGTMQFEDGYVLPAYRGHLVMERVIAHAIKEYAKKNRALKMAQAFTLAGNIEVLITMTKMQWKQARKVMFDSEDILALLPGKGRIQWEMDLTDPNVIAKYLA